MDSIRKWLQKTNKKMLKKFIHVLNLVFEKKMQHPEYFQHVFENKLNLVYLGIQLYLYTHSVKLYTL